MSRSLFIPPQVVLALAGDGAAHGATGSLASGTFTGGTKVRVAGLRNVSVRLAGAFSVATWITVRLVDAGTSTNTDLNAVREIQSDSQADTAQTIAEHAFTASPLADELLVDLGGVVEVLEVQAKGVGAGPYGAGDWIVAELRAAVER